MTWQISDLSRDTQTMIGGPTLPRPLEPLTPPFDADDAPDEPLDDLPPRLPNLALQESLSLDPPLPLGPARVPLHVRKEMQAQGMIPDDEMIRIRQRMFRGICADETPAVMVNGLGEPLT